MRCACIFRRSPSDRPTRDPVQNQPVATTRCLDCDWTGSTLDEARGHSGPTSHTDFRTTTIVSAAGRLFEERVEVHQL
jgi:hypothetical protein